MNNIERYPTLKTEIKTTPLNKTVENLFKSPLTQEKMYGINEDFEKELTDLTIDTQKELNALKNIIEKNLNSKLWVNLRLPQNADFLSDEWMFQNLSKTINLDEIFILWQKFSILDPNTDEQRNVVCEKWKDWKMTYIYEWTKEKVKIWNGMILKQYDKNITYVDLQDEKMWFKPPITSAPSYKSASWVTLCSRTARENLSKLWIKNPKQGSSAKASFDMYWKKAVEFPPKDNSATLVDLYCDASPKNRRYWHRSVWVKIEWKWYVLDPYYGWGSRAPMPAQKYISMMQGKWRKFWWGHVLA